MLLLIDMNIRRWPKAAMVVSIILAVAVLLFESNWARKQLSSPAIIDVQVDGDHVRVFWDREDPRLRPARSGVLTFVDGSYKRSIPLSASELYSQRGITYVPMMDKSPYSSRFRVRTCQSNASRFSRC